jgi:DNA-binding NtrC family response regulator
MTPTLPSVPGEIVALLESLSEPRILVGADYRILAANSAYRHEFGDGRACRGRTCYAISHHYDRPCDQMGESCPLKEARTHARKARVLHLHQTPRGEEHVDVEITPIAGADGEAAYFVETMRVVRRASSRPSAEGMVGRTAPFNRLVELIERAAPTESAVLLLGETGTGKELAARALHESSRRAQGPFVALDCSGLTETLFESELFGYEKGAFTGAINRKTGLVEAAEGGTLFLDEVGDIPLPLQVKLLRLLETGTYRRVGGVETLRADFRLVSATHRDLRAAVHDGGFRADLYYRIGAVPIHVPALRERREDIPLLTASLLERLHPERKFELAPQTTAVLQDYPFPGNIRELRNVLEWASLMADGDVLLPEHLPQEITGERPPPPAASSAFRVEALVPLDELERHYLEWALTRHGGDRRSLARSLGLSPRTLYRRLAAGGVRR